ncbi:hypothetical protein HY250_04325 [Candidatus Azambacteria bacterium]|nr:hypothetical protein [Candidatus Azambacteria bacterium]MBI3685604.1 hypothetical protein [Candidatus Azambacteria bacterium]
MKKEEERRITIGKHTDASALWNEQRRIWRERRFIATLNIKTAGTMFFFSNSLQSRLLPNGSPKTYILLVEKTEDMHEIVRAVKRKHVDQTIIFSPSLQ